MGQGVLSKTCWPGPKRENGANRGTQQEEERGNFVAPGTGVQRSQSRRWVGRGGIVRGRSVACTGTEKAESGGGRGRSWR